MRVCENHLIMHMYINIDPVFGMMYPFSEDQKGMQHCLLHDLVDQLPYHSNQINYQERINCSTGSTSNENLRVISR